MGIRTERQYTLHYMRVDWGQTRYISKHQKYHEVNPLLGEHPTIGRVNRYMLVSGLTHVVVSDFLSPPWRERFQYVTIGLKASVVTYNYSVGIRVDF
jgi:hypothetical protein